eukprot:gnl/TRDRNA2_/TRDRNA2_196116_c0_seq1.p1 gnl/TRDRNA2_/TRDRNA2_196116_c0~~gnl/TRDRNA2_/TRDRNA2_196116_c0_seq1.p1  ORF type:complete len:752 (+),score=138.93 gnl/TRDRNA2_/TRDRNA2_196116_c0_seq1:1-2256(+)
MVVQAGIFNNRGRSRCKQAPMSGNIVPLMEPLFQAWGRRRACCSWKVLAMLSLLASSCFLAGWQRRCLHGTDADIAAALATSAAMQRWSARAPPSRAATTSAVSSRVSEPVLKLDAPTAMQPWTARASHSRVATASAMRLQGATVESDAGMISETVMTSSGVQMPRLMYRTRETIYRLRTEQGIGSEELGVEDLVQRAVMAGFRGVDIADQHFVSGVGVALDSLFASGTRREDLFIQTRVNPSSSEAESMTKQVETLIARLLRELKLAQIDSIVLGLEYIDTADEAVEAWRAMEEAVLLGKVRQLGVSKQGSSSILTLAHLDYLYEEARVKPAIAQTRYSAISGGFMQEFDLRWCYEANMNLQSFGTLTSNIALFKSETMTRLARKYGVAPRVLFFRFMMDLGVMPLITPSLENMKGDASAFRVPLSEQDKSEILMHMRTSAMRQQAREEAERKARMLSEFVTTSSGVKMPRLMYRTRETIYKVREKEPSVDELVQSAVRAGFRGLDIADQQYVRGTGVALASLFQTGVKRDSLFIQSRINPRSSQAQPMAEQVKALMARLLKELKLGYVDSIVLGLEYIDTAEEAIEAWRTLEQQVMSGAVRQLGISKQGSSSILTLAHLDWIYEEAIVKPAVAQTRYDMMSSGFMQQFDLQWCDETKMQLQSFGTLTANHRIVESEKMRSLAAKYDVAPRVLFFRFMMGLGVMPLVTPAIENMEGDAAAYGVPLSDEDKDEIIAQLRTQADAASQGDAA